jgi:diadenosine tetraphosphate (Ap4A) HIT family hydrolase
METLIIVKKNDMRTYYEISSEATGKVLLKRRKVAKALRMWLNEHGISYKYIFFAN